jgi:hypothetical protein
MEWILKDISNALAKLKRGSTWVVIGLVLLFAMLAYAIVQFALRTDSVLRDIRYTVTACQEMTNGPIIFIFCGMIFFLFSAAVALGEIQRYFHYSERGSKYEMAQSLKHAAGWSVFAISLAAGGLIFFNMNCR